ncbi:cell shape-determining protein [Erysipelothrix larvae]|uniref:Cell shape-determining protein MreC n=1 Tax=Erysipelothrix larvae TaxID=1514105 RepID=A0A0X8GZT4_9FIRM|nr:rod shape-determining protein MreC [Erysipelothrix larvae]AMC93426.1 cell shape-determining protein [Erysipelothrix larvae]
MKEKKTFRRLLVGILALVLVSLLGLGAIKRISFVDSADRGFFSFFSMVRYAAIDYPINTVSNFTKDVANFWDSRYEIDRLKEQLSSVSVDASRVYELEQEVEKLKALNQLDSLYSEFSLISGRTVNRAWDSWNQVITINVGSNQGVELNDAVVAANGLIGRVIDVKENSATVSLLTANSQTSQVSVKIIVNSSISIQGILRSYDAENRVFEVQLLDSSATIQQGMQVFTSGLGGVYPTGLVVGVVDSVKPVADSVGIVVYIKSSVNFNEIDYIKVVNRP